MLLRSPSIDVAQERNHRRAWKESIDKCVFVGSTFLHPIHSAATESNWLATDMQSHFSEITNQRNGAVFFAVRIVPLGRDLRNCRAFDFAEDLLLQRFRLSRKQ